MTVRLAELPDINALEVPEALSSPVPSGAPLLLPCDLIDEDPEQPRTAFDDESLRELAATIAERGVRQPVSVRRHPTSEGRWMLNFGARRLRASKLAGKSDIPAFVDEAVDSYDQVIENEQRQGLKPLELALFVKRRLETGTSQAEVARRLGKSKAYICYVCALIDAPTWLLDLYRSGRCTGAHELYDLRRLHAGHPDAIDRIARADGCVTRGDIDALQVQLREVVAREPAATVAPKVPVAPAVATPTSPASCQADVPGPCMSIRATGLMAKSRRPLRLFARVAGCDVEIDLRFEPDDESSVFVCSSAGRPPELVPLRELLDIRLER